MTRRAVSAPEPLRAEGGDRAADRDWEVLRRVAAGESDLFAELVERHQERLLGLCQRLLGNREEAEDACQMVFIKTYRSAAKLERRGQLYTWLYRVATNHCLNQLRRRRVLKFVSLTPRPEDEGASLDPVDAASAPDDQLAARERWARTRRLIDGLPVSQRAVLVLARFEGLSYREIAETLGITEGAVESRLFRAMRTIRQTTGSGRAGEERLS